MRLPRLERLGAALGLCDFEKNVVISMIGQAIAPRSIGLMGGRMAAQEAARPQRRCRSRSCYAPSRTRSSSRSSTGSFFYKSAVLVREGILVLHGDELGADLTQTLAEIDRRMLDFVVGLDTEFSELMDGSHLYTPLVTIDEVVLADAKKQLVLDTVKHFDRSPRRPRTSTSIPSSHTAAASASLLRAVRHWEDDDGQRSRGANRQEGAHDQLPCIRRQQAGAILKLVFREAKIHDAILFFDECESIFMDRTKGNLQVNTVLTELERHEGLCILATNRPMDLDEAMHRRITLAIEFTRSPIFFCVSDLAVDGAAKAAFGKGCRLYAARAQVRAELQGGFIKNAWLSALSIAVSRDGLAPTVTMEDLHSGASHQLRGRLAMASLTAALCRSTAWRRSYCRQT